MKKTDKNILLIIGSGLIFVVAIVIVVLSINSTNTKTLKKVEDNNHKKFIKEEQKTDSKEEQVNNGSKEEIKEESTKSTYIVPTVNSAQTEDAVIETVNYYNTEVDKFISGENNEVNESKLKKIFITLTDFIFYNGTINNKTFNDLTDSGKEKVMHTWEIIDEKITSKYPNYKDTIKSTSGKVYTNLKEKLSDLKTIITNKYQENTTQETKDKVSSTYDVAKEKAKEAYTEVKEHASTWKEKASNWYQKYKGSSD